MKVSICVPVYKMSSGSSPLFLLQFLSDLLNQTYKNFEVIVSDQSDDDTLEKICVSFKHAFEVRYYKNDRPVKNAAANVNFAIEKAQGDIIKLLYMDDFFVDRDALKKIVQAFENSDSKWLICGFVHCNEDKTQFYDARQPSFNNKYVNGDNTTGNPSTYAVRKENVIKMDENLLWLVDGEYFYRSFYYHGDPFIINDILVCFRDHSNSAFKSPELARLDAEERRYCVEKFSKMLPSVHR